MLQVIHQNFKCEDCGGDKFTIHDDFEWGKSELTLFCVGKDCEASYTFSPEIKLRSSSHPPKRCSCTFGLLSSIDKYCSFCGKQNPNYKEEKIVKKKTQKGGKK